jgi:hypothetical protein
MTAISRQQSIQAEKLEDRLAANGSMQKTALTMFNGSIYLGDGREHTLSRKDIMIHLEPWNQAKIYGAAGEIDKYDAVKMYGDAYYQKYGDYAKIAKILEEYPYITANDIVSKGAAGEEAITSYETIRKAAKMAADVSGLQRILEDLTAVNIAKKESTDGFKHEYLRKTSAVQTADKEMSDDQIPGDIRPSFAVGTKEIFADGTSYKTNLRDKELKIDVAAEIAKEIPGMFAQTVEDKVIAKLNAITGTNQGDWDARTAGIFDVRAATDVDTLVNLVKGYGGPIVSIFHSDTWRLYEDNTGESYLGNKPGNQTTVIPSAKHGFLGANPNVEYWIDDNLTSQTYIVASLNSYMKFIQGMIIKTSFKDVRTAGQTETTFEFNYNGVFESETSAVAKGTSVGS